MFSQSVQTYSPARSLTVRPALTLIWSQPRPAVCLKSERKNQKPNNVSPAECGGKPSVLQFPSGNRTVSVTRARPSWTRKGHHQLCVCVWTSGFRGGHVLTFGWRNHVPNPSTAVLLSSAALSAWPTHPGAFWRFRQRKRACEGDQVLVFVLLCIGRSQIYSKGDLKAPTSVKCCFEVILKVCFS